MKIELSEEVVRQIASGWTNPATLAETAVIIACRAALPNPLTDELTDEEIVAKAIYLMNEESRPMPVRMWAAVPEIASGVVAALREAGRLK